MKKVKSIIYHNYPVKSLSNRLENGECVYDDKLKILYHFI